MATTKSVDGRIVGVRFNSIGNSRREKAGVFGERSFKDGSRESRDLVVFGVLIEEASVKLLTVRATEIEMQEAFTFRFVRELELGGIERSMRCNVVKRLGRRR